MNRRRQIQLSPEEQATFLREHRKAALATIDQDGFPHVVAMNFLVKDGAFYMTSYAKAQKVLNIRRNPKVALMAEAGDTYCRAARRHGSRPLRDHRRRRRRCGRPLRKWRRRAAPPASGRADRSTARPKRVVLKIIPEKIVSWDHSKLGGGY